jgi:predicted permease
MNSTRSSFIKRARQLWRRLGYYIRRDKFDRELEAEMRFHLEMKTEARMAAGLPAREAYRTTRLQFGNSVLIQERSREMWTFRWIQELTQDLRYSFRMIKKSPALTAVVVSSLALAIGASTAIFSLVDAVLLKPLPVQSPGQLVLFGWAAGSPTPAHWASGDMRLDPKTGERNCTSFSSAQFQQMRDQNQTLSCLFAFAPIYSNLNLSVDGQADVATGQLVSGEYYNGLGVSALLGRTIDDNDDRTGAEPVAVITYKCWKQRFGLNPAIVGKPAFINGIAFTIVGITPPDFDGALEIGDTADLTLPLAAQPAIDRQPPLSADSWRWWLRIMGRLKPGATIEQARANLEGPFQQSALDGHQALLAVDPKGVPDPVNMPRLTPMSGAQGLNVARRDYSRQLYVLLILVVLVMLIACANTANLLLARSAARQKEVAIRIALGAGRPRVIRQLLTESVTLAIISGLAGLLLAYWAKGFLMVVSPSGAPPVKLDLTLNVRVLMFSAVTTIATGIIFGVAPAFRATRVDAGPALKDAAASHTPGRHRLALGKTLVLIQVAISLPLLVGAGLFLHTLRNLEQVDYGFDANNLLLFNVNPSLNGYDGAALAHVYGQIADRINTIPGVESTTISRFPLLSGSEWEIDGVKVPGDAVQPPADAPILLLPVKENFLETMRIPLLAGRGLTAQDSANSGKVAVISEAFARLCFKEGDAVGHHIAFPMSKSLSDLEIVGVARNARYDSLRGDPPNVAYLPFVQHIARIETGMSFEVRAAGDPAALVPSIRKVVLGIDGSLAISDVKTQQEQIRGSYVNERMFAGFTAALGALALLLAAIGLYGMISYNVSRRTNEIGIRMALGADARKLMLQIMRQAMLLVSAGLVIGAGASLAATRLISSTMLLTADPNRPSLLFGVSPKDPATIALAALFLVLVAILAAYLPGRRASRIDPLLALRYE